MRIRTATAAATLAFAAITAPVIAAPAATAAPTSDKSVFRSALAQVWFDQSPRERARLCSAFHAYPARIVVAITKPSVQRGYIDKYAAAQVTIKFLFNQCGPVA